MGAAFGGQGRRLLKNGYWTTGSKGDHNGTTITTLRGEPDDDLVTVVSVRFFRPR